MHTVTADPIPAAVLTAIAAYVVVTLNIAARSRRREKTPAGRGDPAARETGYPTMRIRPRHDDDAAVPDGIEDPNWMELAA